MTKGVIYITTGIDYTNLALASAKSLKNHNPHLSVHLLTDIEKIKSPYIDTVEAIIKPHRRSKVDYMHKSPFDQTLYLDADTFILDQLDEIFDILQRFDIALGHAHRRNNQPNLQEWKTKIPYSFPQMNSGVILYKKNDQTQSLLKSWQVAYHMAKFKKDQVTLRELLWLSELRIHILPPEYNIRFRKYLEIWTEKEAKPKILHLEEFSPLFTS